MYSNIGLAKIRDEGTNGVYYAILENVFIKLNKYKQGRINDVKPFLNVKICRKCVKWSERSQDIRAACCTYLLVEKQCKISKKIRLNLISGNLESELEYYDTMLLFVVWAFLIKECVCECEQMHIESPCAVCTIASKINVTTKGVRFSEKQQLTAALCYEIELL